MRVDPLGSSKGMSDILSEETRISNRRSSESFSESLTKDISDFISDFKKKMEKFQEVVRGELQFEIDRDINMIIVKIKDKDTGEVIRQIPSEVVVKLAKALDEFLGLLMDERA